MHKTCVCSSHEFLNATDAIVMSIKLAIAWVKFVV